MLFSKNDTSIKSIHTNHESKIVRNVYSPLHTSHSIFHCSVLFPVTVVRRRERERERERETGRVSWQVGGTKHKVGAASLEDGEENFLYRRSPASRVNAALSRHCPRAQSRTNIQRAVCTLAADGRTPSAVQRALLDGLRNGRAQQGDDGARVGAPDHRAARHDHVGSGL